MGDHPVDWARFWDSDDPGEEWIAEPLIARGRTTVIFSKAKVGKSLLALDIAAALATGRAVLGQTSKAPVSVVYVDMEMTESDLRERLEDLGYGPDDDLTLLRYYQLPPLPPLDGPLGGEILFDIATESKAEVVVIDTMAGAVAGPEDKSDTYRAFYRFTGWLLKAAGVALFRLDHEGKDGAQGPRGSSSKDEDVDVIFRLTAGADGRSFKIKRTATRVPWAPLEVDIIRHEEPLRHVIQPGYWPEGTSECAALLDDLGVPLDASTRTAGTALKNAGTGRRRALVVVAMKFRRTRP